VTWQNALFVVVGAGLMVLLEWARHRLEGWWNEGKVKTALMVLGFVLIILAGVAVIALALKSK